MQFSFHDKISTRDLLIKMICDTCEAIFATDNGYTDFISERRTMPHHRTCRSLKHSVDLGCYICNGLWATLKPDERNLVSASPRPSPQASYATTSPCAGNLQANSVEQCVTASSLEDGDSYGRPRCYLLQLCFNPNVVATEKLRSRVYWRATFVLQPCDGMLCTRSRISTFAR
jgi:hypothetical protein